MSSNRERRQTRSLTTASNTINNNNSNINDNNINTVTNSKRRDSKFSNLEPPLVQPLSQLQIKSSQPESETESEQPQQQQQQTFQTRTSLRRTNSTLSSTNINIKKNLSNKNNNNSSILSNKTQNSILTKSNDFSIQKNKSDNVIEDNKNCLKLEMNKKNVQKILNNSSNKSKSGENTNLNSNTNTNISHESDNSNNSKNNNNVNSNLLKIEVIIPSTSSISSSSASSSSSEGSLPPTKIESTCTNQIITKSQSIPLSNSFNNTSTSTINQNDSTCKNLTSQKISTRRRSSNYLNQLRINTSSSSLLDQSLPSNLSRKRNLSSSLDINAKNENHLNIENLNNTDLCNQAQASSSASSSGAQPSSTFQNLNKRLKLKHKYAFKELSINENNLQTSFRLLSKDEFDNSSLNENKEELEEVKEEDPDPKESLQCPVQGCNSEGHLDGVSEHHFSFDTCPIYFEMNKEDCIKRKIDLDKRLNDLDEKINRINENKKNLRNKNKTKEQTEYYDKVNKELKNIIKPTEPITKNRLKINFLHNNPELVGDIKSLTTSFIINSISNCLTPTPMPIYHHSLIKHSNNATNNFLNNLNQTQAQTPSIADLGVSKFDLDLFKDNLIASTKETIPQNKDNNIKKLKLVNKTSKIIQFGNHEIETWYKSPYPDDFWQLNKIFICQYCLIYMKSHSVLNRHLEKCLWRHPPGREIYRKDSLSFFEVDGKFNIIYCQNLCLLAKLFLDHKTLYYDVEPFLFYVLTQYNEETGSFQMIGYFSKEKQSVMNYNLSCILILPQFMNQGYGRVLIDFSYLLSRVEGKVGSPERPLSDLGLISYRSYWKSKLLIYLSRHMDDSEISVKEISAETGVLTNDLISTLQYMGLIKYWKGKHVILKDKELIEKYIERKNITNDVDPTCLKWTPYVYQTIINESDAPVHSMIVKGNKINYSAT